MNVAEKRKRTLELLYEIDDLLVEQDFRLALMEGEIEDYLDWVSS